MFTKNILILFAISEIINFVNYKVLCIWPNAILLKAIYTKTKEKKTFVNLEFFFFLSKSTFANAK